MTEPLDTLVPEPDAHGSNCAQALTRKDFQTQQEIRWCPGCGDFAVLSQIQKVLPELGLPRENFVFVSGIGCSSRFPYYVNTYGFHGIHGRAPALAWGVHCANPDLSVWVVTGDGDGLSIGTNHLIHCLRRNLDITILLFNNRIYGLTKGQYSPTSEFGKRTKSSPQGTIEQPIHPVQTALAAQATFVARTLFSDQAHLGQTFLAAAHHRGSAFIEIMQNCRVFNSEAFENVSQRSTAEDSRVLLEHGKPIRFGKDQRKAIVVRNMKPMIVDLDQQPVDEREILVHDSRSESPALAALLSSFEPPDFPVALGIFRQLEKPTYGDLLFGQIESAMAQRGKGDVRRLLNAGTTWDVT